MVCVVIGGVCLSGCTPASTNTPPTLSEPALGAIATITSPDQIVLPTDAYILSTEQSLALVLAEKAMLDTCILNDGGSTPSSFQFIDERGLSNPTPVSTVDVTAYIDSLRGDPKRYNTLYGFFNPATATISGYDRYPSVREVSWWKGSGDPIMDSCVARLNSVKPTSPESAWVFTDADLPDGGEPWHVSDSRMVAATQSWSECMNSSGYQYASPVDAWMAYPPVIPGSPAPASEMEEQALARADIQCKRETNLVGIAVAVQSAYEQEYVDSHRDALVQMQSRIADFIAGRVTLPDAVETTATPSMDQS